MISRNLLFPPTKKKNLPAHRSPCKKQSSAFVFSFIMLFWKGATCVFFAGWWKLQADRFFGWWNNCKRCGNCAEVVNVHDRVCSEQPCVHLSKVRSVYESFQVFYDDQILFRLTDLHTADLVMMNYLCPLFARVLMKFQVQCLFRSVTRKKRRITRHGRSLSCWCGAQLQLTSKYWLTMLPNSVKTEKVRRAGFPFESTLNQRTVNRG